MNRNERFVITVNRQFGTGGHEIGAALADRLGVKLIDRQILLAVARKFNLSEQQATELENRRPSWWEDFSKFYKAFADVNHYSPENKEITSRQLFYAQVAAMRKIAGEESCVVVGRCGFDVFANHSNKLSFFLHSSLEKRIERIMRKYGVDETEARIMIEDNDYTRELYTKTFTGKNWYDCSNYDVTLDVTKFGVNGATDFLMGIIDDLR